MKNSVMIMKANVLLLECRLADLKSDLRRYSDPSLCDLKTLREMSLLVEEMYCIVKHSKLDKEVF